MWSHLFDIYQSCSRVENNFTLSSLLLPPLPLASLCLRFYSTSPFTRLKPVRTLPRFVRKFLGLPKFLVFFSEQREREAETGNLLLIVQIFKADTYLSLYMLVCCLVAIYHRIMKSLQFFIDQKLFFHSFSRFSDYFFSDISLKNL